MRLDFNVLWVEDSQDLVTEQKVKLERLIRKEGFRLRVKFAASVQEAKESIAQDIYGDHVDLVLMDYNLGAGPNGDQGLIAVRNVLPFKDIIFYSAQANNLRDILAKTNVQGIYLSNRDELPDTAEGLFHTLVKKVLDIDHSRGLVMGATSDIDHFINDCLEMLFAKSDPEMQAQVISLVTLRMKEIRKRFEDSAIKIEAIKAFAELADQHAVYTSADRLNLLRKILKQRNLDEKIRDALKLYASDVVPKRNDLAHVRVQIDGFSRKLLNRKGEELTSDEMRTLRLSLLENQELFEQLHLSLKDPA